jgi:hypothetical protein
MGSDADAWDRAREGIFRAGLSRFLPFFAVVASLGLASCASSGLHTTSQHLGRGTERAVLDVVPLTLHRFGYPVANYRETPSAIYFETPWVQRLPFEDEAEGGAEAVRTRITIEARRAGKLYSVWLRVENAALAGIEDARWQPIDASKMLQEQLAHITTAIRDEIDTGLRVY